MLIADVNTAHKLVGITTCGSSNTDVTIVVSATDNTRLVGNTKAIATIVVPETLRTDMTTRFTIVPFQIDIGKVFPRIMIVGFMLVGKSQVHSSLIEQSGTKRNTVASILS